MADRPYTVLSAAMSLDGFLDAGTSERLILSTPADLERVDALRATCDAILVGAATVRRDNPRLLVRAPGRRADRIAQGLPDSPVKVTVTGSGDLDPDAAFFTAGTTERLVYCPPDLVGDCARRLGDRATIVGVDGPGVLVDVLADLAGRGVRRLLVEGGGRVHTQLLTGGLADELRLAVAPFFVGNPTATRLAGDGGYPWCPDHRARLVDAARLDDLAVLRYALSDRFEES